MSTKSNLYHLQKILAELRETPYDGSKFEEAAEFLTAAIEDVWEYEKRTDELEEELDKLRDEADKVDFNSDFIGLDTIVWKLEKENLAIRQEVETFITHLKNKNGATVAK